MAARRTRSAKKAENILTEAEEQATAEKAAKEYNDAIEKKRREHVQSDSDMSDGSESSSSAEDSDDDFEVEMGITKKKTVSATSDSDDDECQNNAYLNAIEKKMDKKIKKNRIQQKIRKKSKNHISDDEDLICEFESNNVQRNRKRRLYRRKMLRGPGVVKRRRIKRTTVDVTEDYTCETFLEFGSTTTKLTSSIDDDDREIDKNALKKVFKELGIMDTGDSGDEYSEEDEADIVANQLKFYYSRNSRERIDQLNNLPINPFAEKLIGYNSLKSVHGSNCSSIQNYHPDIFNDEKTYKLPPSLLWNRHFTHLIYQSSKFDPHKECNDYLREVETEAKEQCQKKLMEEIFERIREKAVEKNPHMLANTYEDPLYMEDDDEPMDHKFKFSFHNSSYSNDYNAPSTSTQHENEDELFIFKQEVEEPYDDFSESF